MNEMKKLAKANLTAAEGVKEEETKVEMKPTFWTKVGRVAKKVAEKTVDVLIEDIVPAAIGGMAATVSVMYMCSELGRIQAKKVDSALNTPADVKAVGPTEDLGGLGEL